MFIPVGKIIPESIYIVTIPKKMLHILTIIITEGAHITINNFHSTQLFVCHQAINIDLILKHSKFDFRTGFEWSYINIVPLIVINIKLVLIFCLSGRMVRNSIN